MGKKNLYERIWNRLVGSRIYVFCERISCSVNKSRYNARERESYSSGESFAGPILIIGNLIDHDNVCVVIEVQEIKYPSGLDMPSYLDYISSKEGFVVIKKSEIKMFGAFYDDVSYEEVFGEEIGEEKFLSELEKEE